MTGVQTCALPISLNRVHTGDSLWSLAEEHPVEGLTTQETSDMIRSVNHLERGSLDAGAVLKVPARP